MNDSYRNQALASASQVELVIALYDGAIRFLTTAMAAVPMNDVIARRFAVKRALDIYLHLQSRLCRAQAPSVVVRWSSSMPICSV